ncbi:battenin isoform X1 [Schistocerca nitens]|uniref:battenin isoform X1 n=2 Tax=Schistocerca nitens TaxID=7011 RepID=UPI00211780B2|nr:battenin isoform X1 [Schistocerca nitens]
MVCFRCRISAVVPVIPISRRLLVKCRRVLHRSFRSFAERGTENVAQSKVKKFSMDEQTSDSAPLQQHQVQAKWRNLAAYWLLGLCNNYGYVVMLSAAHDILKTFDTNSTVQEPSNATSSDVSQSRDCNEISTAAILLADILPALFVKLIAPFLPFYVHIRMSLTVVLSIASFLLVALSGVKWATFLGVIATSFGSGLGELTLLGYTSSFNWNPITAWSSGTGAAGVLGAGSYAGLTALGISPNDSLLIMLAVPAVMALSFWVLLERPSHSVNSVDTPGVEEFQSNVSIQSGTGEGTVEVATVAEASAVADIAYENESLKTKLKYIPSLLKYMVPLGTVYLFEYFINQGLFELIYFPGIWISHSEQYRWMQLCYQIGVFISRTSASFIIIRQIWLMSILQLINVVLFTLEAIYWFVPSVWIVFAFVLWEGLLGGAAYVNTFHRISTEVPPEKEKFSLSITSLADSLGIGLAGAISLPVHNAICLLPL